MSTFGLCYFNGWSVLLGEWVGKLQCSKQWCRRRGCKRTSKCFYLSKIHKNLGKLIENMGKNGDQRCLIWEWSPTSAESHEDLFRRSSQKGYGLYVRKYSHKNSPEDFSGKFGTILAKIFRTPKICLLLHLWFEDSVPSAAEKLRLPTSIYILEAAAAWLLQLADKLTKKVLRQLFVSFRYIV